MRTDFPFPVISTPNTFTVVLRGRPYSLTRGSKAHTYAMHLLAEGDEATEDKVLALVDPVAYLAEHVEGLVVNDNGEVYYEDRYIRPAVVSEIYDFLSSGEGAEEWVRWLHRPRIYDPTNDDGDDDQLAFLAEVRARHEPKADLSEIGLDPTIVAEADEILAEIAANTDPKRRRRGKKNVEEAAG
jgi:hypothetical protein